MDLVDLIKEKKFLGEEFLTWVWVTSEINSGLVNLEGLGPVEVWFEDRMVLESGSGNFRQAVTCQGKNLELAEARTAIIEGKKVSQVRLRISSDGREWRLTVKAEGLELGSIRAPKTLDEDEEEPEGEAGRLLERVALIQELTTIMDALFRTFIKVRLTDAWEETELPRIRQWLSPE